jgi:hypothetical protein
MDIYCPKCGEPWDIDSIHEATAELVAENHRPYDAIFKTLLRDFQQRGCAAIGYRCSESDTETDDSFGLTRAEASSALYDLLGDDIDGAASMLDDMFG